MLTQPQIDEFRSRGHLTVHSVFDARQIQAALDDLDRWGHEFLATMSDEQRGWYLEQAAQGSPALRKLDNPVYLRPEFQQLARHPPLVAMVEQLIGSGVSVVFSQVFMKPPDVGGRKPMHQDNFYFGPDDPDAMVTAWIALDDATIENGCLFYGDQHQAAIIDHVAPEGEPFNLQIPEATAANIEMQPAPVPSGGVSFHHGNTPHQSSANRSKRARRAVAMHFIQNSARLTRPALQYDTSNKFTVS